MLSKFKTFVWEWLLRVTDAFALCLPLRHVGRPSAGLIVRLDHLGDFVLWVGLMPYFTEFFGQKPVLVCSDKNAEFAQTLGLFDSVIGVNLVHYKRSLVYRFRMNKRMKALQVPVCVQPTYSRSTFEGDSLVRMSGAKRRIGVVGDLSVSDQKQRRLGDAWYTELIPVEAQHELEINAAVAAAVTGKSVQNKLHPFDWPRERDWPELLGNKYLVLFPGAAADGRRWPLEKFAQCAVQMEKEFGLQMVIAGAQSELALAKELEAELKDLQPINLVGKTSVTALFQVIHGACALLSNDTSAVHIAALVNTPSVCVLGGGHFGRFHPYLRESCLNPPQAVFEPMTCFGCQWRCEFDRPAGAPFPCVERVSQDQVIRTLRAILNQETYAA